MCLRMKGKEHLWDRGRGVIGESLESLESNFVLRSGKILCGNRDH